uniref:15-hydroxyprostaglandin dehydrogenase [NAD(+)] n=1 Tax=Hemiscolopendra marginata TaxID=943146 RepID=A0A646QER7_9MYRI
MVNLEGKAALVTGASQGIGKQTVIELLKKKIKVAIADIAVDKGEETAKELQKEYGDKNVIFIKLDVTNETEFEAAIVKAKSVFGRLDYLLNNAGVAGEENWRRTIDINLNAVIIGTQLGLHHLSDDKGQKTGTMIINTASIVGINAMVINPVYTASKHGCVGFTKCWGSEVNVAKTGVKVNAVCPEATDTVLIRDLGVSAVNQSEAAKLKDCISKTLVTTDKVASAFIKLLEEEVTGKLLVVSYEKGLYYSPYDTYY